MSVLDGLKFVKKPPAKVPAGHDPMERARKKLLSDLDTQIALARDANFVIRRERKKQDGTTEVIERKPKSWVVAFTRDYAYLGIRFSNKLMPIGGKRGSYIELPIGEVPATLERVRESVQHGELDQQIEKIMKEAKRKPRKKT